MSLDNRVNSIINEFGSFPDWEARYRHLIEIGRNLPPFPEELRSEDLKVKGCQSQVWIHAQLSENGNIKFQADSDALIVKGLVGVLLRIYSDASPEEVLETSPDFIEKLGFKSHLSPSRANGFYSMLKQIQYYATAFKIILDRKKSI